MDFETLIFGDEDPYLVKTQAPIQRPDPIPRPAPVERPGSRAPAPPRFQFKPEAAPKFGGMVDQESQPAAPAQKPGMRPLSDKEIDDLIFGDGTPMPQRQAQKPQPAAPSPGFKPIEKEGWGEWFVNNVMGRKDPRFGELPSIREALDQEYQRSDAPWTDNPLVDLVSAAAGGVRFKAPSENWSNPFWKITAGAALTGDDEAQGNIVKNALGDRFIGLEKDAHGAVIVNYRGTNGLPQKAYVNRPGLEGEDVRDFVGQAAPYMLMGRMAGAVMPGNGLLGMAGQGLGAGSVSMLQDAGAFLLGSEKAPDPMKAGVVGTITSGLHGLAPIAGNLWRKLVTEPGLFNRSAGTLTPRGVEAAKAAGLNPADLPEDIAAQFAKEYARTGSSPVAGQTVAGREFGIQGTRGQITKRPDYLANEEAMRRNILGDPAREIITRHDQAQRQAIADAVMGDGPKSIAARIAPSRGGDVPPVVMGTNIQGGLQAARETAKGIEKEAWKNVGPVYGTEEAFGQLPRFTAEAIGDLAPGITKETTPMTARMLDTLRKLKAGDPLQEADEFLGGAFQPELDTVRRSLLAMMKGAQGTDKNAAGRVYGAYNSWLKSMEDQALLIGDEGTYAAMRAARDATAGWRGIFSERDFRGSSEPGRRIVQNILDKTDSPEGIVRQLFGTTPQADIKPGAIEAVRLIKRGVQTYLPEDQAKVVVDDLKLGYWLNLTKDPAGNVRTPTMLAKNIDQALQKQASAMRELFAPDEIALMRRFSYAMKQIAYKDPNPSGTSYNVAQFTKNAGQALLRLLAVQEGPLAKLMSMALGSTPIINQVGRVSAQAAVNPRIPSVNPPIAPVGAAITDARREARQ